MKKVLGLILELNPYHNGHQYLIDKAKEDIKPDVTIAVISSSFMMRGDIMIMDKFSKTKLLLDKGIDLVVELPFISGVNSSDLFSKTCVKILNDFKVTDICFGSELNDLDKLQELVKINESDSFNFKIKEYLNKGYSYTTSSIKAISDLTNDVKLSEEFAKPNNTLAIGYLKEINKTKITPHIIKRINNNYYDEEINDSLINSATSLRNLIDRDEDISKYIPNYNYNFYKSSKLNNKLYKLFQYKMINNQDILNIKGISEGIENRILSFINSKSYDEFINNIVTKRYTKNKIKRLMLYILLDIKKEYEFNDSYYKRVLGMSEVGKKHLNSLDKITKKELISTFKDGKYDIIYKDLIDIELRVSKLYGLLIDDYDFYYNEFNIPFRKEENK